MVANEHPVLSTVLVGMKDITNFLGRSEKTVLSLIRQYAGTDNPMPVTRDGHIWVSDRIELNEWNRRRLAQASPAGPQAPMGPPPAPLSGQEDQVGEPEASADPQEEAPDAVKPTPAGKKSR